MEYYTKNRYDVSFDWQCSKNLCKKREWLRGLVNSIIEQATAECEASEAWPSWQTRAPRAPNMKLEKQCARNAWEGKLPNCIVVSCNQCQGFIGKTSNNIRERYSSRRLEFPFSPSPSAWAPSPPMRLSADSGEKKRSQNGQPGSPQDCQAVKRLKG